MRKPFGYQAAAAALAAFFCLTGVWGCNLAGGGQAEDNASTVTQYSAGVGNEADSLSAADSSAEESKQKSAEDESGDFTAVTTIPAEDMPNDVSLTPPHSSAPATSSADFNAVFSQNPIDKAYNQQSKTAESTRQMVELAEKFITIWDAEVDSAYQRLLAYLDADGKEKLKKQQEQWQGGLEKAIQKIYDDAAADSDGTIAQVAASSGVMEYYKKRAIELYLRLFEFEPNLTYAYQKGE